MASDVDFAFENLARFVQAISYDPELRRRFFELGRLSVADRFSRIQALADEMASNGEAAEIVSSFRLLAEPTIFSAAIRALQECDNQQ